MKQLMWWAFLSKSYILIYPSPLGIKRVSLQSNESLPNQTRENNQGIGKIEY